MVYKVIKPTTNTLTNGGTDERRGIADVVEAFLLDEVSNG